MDDFFHAFTWMISFMQPSLQEIEKVFNGNQDFRSAPQPLSVEAILHKMGKHKVGEGKYKGIIACCWKKSILFDLEYLRHLLVCHN